MPTVKTRLNITLSDDLHQALVKIAHRDRLPSATKAAKLLEIALELEEDQVWDTLAKEREKKIVGYVTHKKAWK